LRVSDIARAGARAYRPSSYSSPIETRRRWRNQVLKPRLRKRRCGWRRS
jgi:hypothetical protein